MTDMPDGSYRKLDYDYYPDDNKYNEEENIYNYIPDIDVKKNKRKSKRKNKRIIRQEEDEYDKFFNLQDIPTERNIGKFFKKPVSEPVRIEPVSKPTITQKAKQTMSKMGMPMFFRFKSKNK